MKTYEDAKLFSKVSKIIVEGKRCDNYVLLLP